MIDPVDNFEIPAEWIKRARITPDELELRISSGRYVLLCDGSLLRRGFTTGTTAAAAAKAAVLSLKGDVSEVSVPTPLGIRAFLPVHAKNGTASAIKDSGDHAIDVTKGIEIRAEAKENETILIKAGTGIG
ncbi:MAG: cobalt-precorrin-5B (C(1))-methyltransferase, partial [Candidatus Methanoperedens sp.]